MLNPDKQHMNVDNARAVLKMTAINNCLLKLIQSGFKVTNIIQSDLSRNAVIWIRPNKHCKDLKTTSTVSGEDKDGKYRVMVCTEYKGCQVQWYDRRSRYH